MGHSFLNISTRITSHLWSNSSFAFSDSIEEAYYAPIQRPIPTDKTFDNEKLFIDTRCSSGTMAHLFCTISSNNYASHSTSIPTISP